MSTLHVYSNRHIHEQVHNVKQKDVIYLQNSLSKKRWLKYFKYNSIDDASLELTYITQDDFFNLQGTKDNMTFPFDAVVGNPPFNDDQNKKANTGNYVSASKKLHLEFIDKSLTLASEVHMVSPVRGWFVAYSQAKNSEKYMGQVLYLIENKGMPFNNAVTGEIGVFHFDKNKTFIRDEFEQRSPLDYSIVNQFKMHTMVGNRTPSSLTDNLKDNGKYRVILTSTKFGYTDNNNLFEDQSRGKWRVAFNHNGNKTGSSIYGGKMQVATPEDYLSMSMSCFIVNSKEEAEAVCKYMMSDNIMDLMREIKVSNTNTIYHMSFVPPYVK